MNNLGREDKADFETLQELFKYLDSSCYKKWSLPLITHSDEMGELRDRFLQIY